jgi:hypothetical protein
LTGGEDTNWVSDVVAAESNADANVLAISMDNQVNPTRLVFPPF